MTSRVRVIVVEDRVELYEIDLSPIFVFERTLLESRFKELFIDCFLGSGLDVLDHLAAEDFNRKRRIEDVSGKLYDRNFKGIRVAKAFTNVVDGPMIRERHQDDD